MSFVKERRRWLEEEINEERERHGRKPLEFHDKEETKTIKVSRTDPESGYYHRSEKEKGFMYLDHRTVDHKCNIIVDAYVTKGNVHDSSPYIGRMEYIKEKYEFDIKRVALDSGYDTIEIKKFLHDNEIFGVIGYRRYGTKENLDNLFNLQIADRKASAPDFQNIDSILNMKNISEEILNNNNVLSI